MKLPPSSTISAEKAFFIIVKAREFDEQVAPSDPKSGSNPTDDRDVDVLEAKGDDPTLQELEGALAALNIDEQLDLLALTWLGRGDFPVFRTGEARGRGHAHQALSLHTSSARRSSATFWKKAWHNLAIRWRSLRSINSSIPHEAHS